MKKDIFKNKIIDFLKFKGELVNKKKIYKKFKNIEKKEIDKILNELLNQKIITYIDNKILLNNNNTKNSFIGKLSISKDGYGFVDPLNGGKGVFIPARYIGYSLPDDIVICRFFKNKKNKNEGRIEKIIKRNITQLVCSVEKKGKRIFVKPINLRTHFKLKVNKKRELKNIKEGDFILVSISNETSPHKIPSITIIKNIGNLNSKELYKNIIINKYNLPINFNKEVIKEADKIKSSIEEELKNRIDLRDKICFTIDPDDAKDFDDAVGIEKISDDKYRLFIHIADVSFYVKENSLIDKEAYKRATSVYLPDTCIPMLPEKLSNEICSLKPNEDRLTITVEIVLNKKAEILKSKIYESVIKSKERLTYKIVQKILDNDSNLRQKFSHILNSILMMNDITEILYKKRERKGSLDFDLPEPEIILDKNGVPLKVNISERLFSQKIIEEFMILANETVAKFMFNKNLPAIYRVHDYPIYEKVQDFINFIKFLGVKIKKQKNIQKFFQEVIEKFKDRPEKKLVNYLMLRCMAIARYSTKNIGHFGLASKCYTHFTSPIRRYADLTFHRLLKLALHNCYDEKKQKFWSNKLEKICEHITAKSIKADEIEREAVELKLFEFISNKIGEKFEAIIVKITEKEIIAELTDYLVEGYIPLKDIKDDFYIVDNNHYYIKGLNKKIIFRIGDKIFVEILNIDILNRKVKLNIV